MSSGTSTQSMNKHYVNLFDFTVKSIHPPRPIDLIRVFFSEKWNETEFFYGCEPFTADDKNQPMEESRLILIKVGGVSSANHYIAFLLYVRKKANFPPV